MKRSGLSGKMMVNLVLLGLSIMAYDILYLATVLYVPFQSAYGLTNTQISDLLAINSAACIVGYLFSGWLCDRFSPKKCLVAAVLVSGSLALWLSTMPSYPTLKVIFALLVSINFVWAPYIKCMTMLSGASSSGRVFGTAAMIEAAVSGLMFAVPIFLVGDGIALPENFSRLTRIFAVFVLAEGIGLALFFDYDSLLAIQGKQEQTKPASVKNILVVVKMPVTWIVLLINLCYYGVMSEMTYISAYLNQIFFFPVGWTTLFIVANRFFVRSAATYLGGSLRDRFGSVGKSMGLSCIITLCCFLLLLFLPGKPGFLPGAMVVSTSLFFSFFLNSNAANVALAELKPPTYLTGTIIGFYSVCYSLANLAIQSVSGRVLDRYPVWGFRITMLIACGLLLLWILASKLLIWYQKQKS